MSFGRHWAHPMSKQDRKERENIGTENKQGAKLLLLTNDITWILNLWPFLVILLFLKYKMQWEWKLYYPLKLRKVKTVQIITENVLNTLRGFHAFLKTDLFHLFFSNTFYMKLRTSHTSLWTHPLDTDCIVPGWPALCPESWVVITDLCCWWWDSWGCCAAVSVTQMLWGGGRIAQSDWNLMDFFWTNCATGTLYKISVSLSGWNGPYSALDKQVIIVPDSEKASLIQFCITLDYSL